MNRYEIEKLYKSKLKELQHHDKLYHQESEPIISDADYDRLKHEIIKIEKENKFLKSEISPSKKVGYKPSKSFAKYTHKARMLSLSNAFDKADLENFEKKILNYLNTKINLEYSVEPKIDGISASLTYINNKLEIGVSRGDGLVGEIITDNLKTIKDIPQKIESKDFPENIEIRGEVFITKKNFSKLKDKFANARNAASGSLRQKDSNETKKIPLNFVAYTYGYIKKNNFNSQSEFLFKLKKWGFKINKENKIKKSIEELLEFHKKFELKRFSLDYDVDGLVYKVNDISLQNRLGYTSNSPRWAIAHKFSADSSYTKILNIEIQIGRTGALTPVAKVQKVNIGGVLVSNATLHNEDEIVRKDIRIGDVVKIERAGDVIPHVIEVDITKRKKNLKKFAFPLKCPSCGSKTIKEYNQTTKKYDAVRRCTNESYDCEKIAIEKLKHFISKDALNIDGLGKKVIEKFWELHLIKKPQDIFNLNYDKIEKLDGWGKLSTNNLKSSIQVSKNTSLQKLIYSLGIRHIGIENAKLISENVKSLKSFIDIISNDKINKLLNIDGIGQTQINSLKNFFSDKTNIKVLLDLDKILNINLQTVNKNGVLKDKTFMFTGKLEGISRAEAKSLIEKNSGTTLSSVSKNLDFVVIGQKPTKRKIDQAKALGVQIISQNELKKLID